jgi:hypothetical protein
VDGPNQQVAPAQRQLPGAWPKPVGGNDVSDDTRPNDHGSPGTAPDRAATERWVEALCPPDLRRQLDELEAEGRVVLALAVPWTEAVRATLDRYERAVAGHHLGDHLHGAVAREVGVDRLYDQLDLLGVAIDRVS